MKTLSETVAAYRDGEAHLAFAGRFASEDKNLYSSFLLDYVDAALAQARSKELPEVILSFAEAVTTAKGPVGQEKERTEQTRNMLKKAFEGVFPRYNKGNLASAIRKSEGAGEEAMAYLEGLFGSAEPEKENPVMGILKGLGGLFKKK